MKKLLLAAAFATLSIAPAFAGNVWHTDDGRPGNDIELNRVFAGCHMTAMGSVHPSYASGGDMLQNSIAQIGINLDTGRAIDAIMGECMRAKGWLPGEAPAARAPAPLNLPPIPPRSTKGLNANQIKVGCSWEKGYGVSCPGPGTGDVLQERAQPCIWPVAPSDLGRSVPTRATANAAAKCVRLREPALAGTCRLSAPAAQTLFRLLAPGPALRQRLVHHSTLVGAHRSLLSVSPGRSLSWIARVADKASIRFGPIFRNFLLRYRSVERTAAHQRTHASLESILRLRIKRRLDRSPGLRPQVAIIVCAAEAKRDQMVHFVLGVRAAGQAVLGHNPVVAFSRPMTQASRRTLVAYLANIGRSHSAGRESRIGDDRRIRPGGRSQHAQREQGQECTFHELASPS